VKRRSSNSTKICGASRSLSRRATPVRSLLSRDEASSLQFRPQSRCAPPAVRQNGGW
jgi:hypothetical protein